MTIKTVARQTTPLCFMPDGRLVCYKRGKVKVMKDGNAALEFRIPLSYKEHLFGWSRLATRLFRFGIRAAIAMDNNHILLSIGNKIHELSFKDGSFSNGFSLPKGTRPLQFSSISSIKGFVDGFYFGGYVHNPNKAPVELFRRTKEDKWEVVYTFPQGTTNHIHNIVADAFRNCLWVFTGDFGDAAAIWRIKDNFNSVERYAFGNQCWRGSVVFVTEEGVLYATDTPRAKDYLFLLIPETRELNKITALDGSCIYGCQWKDNYVLATTVESDGGDMGFLKKWLGRKRGKGIKDDYVHMIFGNTKDGFREIFKERKDFLPFTPFQFGTIKFPAGFNSGDTLYFQPVATINNDQRLMAIESL